MGGCLGFGVCFALGLIFGVFAWILVWDVVFWVVWFGFRLCSWVVCLLKFVLELLLWGLFVRGGWWWI